MHPAEAIPRWLWRALLLACVGLIGVGLAGALLLAAGVADPARLGRLAWSHSAEPGACLEAGILDLPVLAPPYTLELSAARQPDADEFATWGLWLADPGDDSLHWEVLPPGYFRHAGQTVDFHHVHPGENVLRLDVSAGGFVLWLNHERAAAGVAPEGAVPWGLVDAGDICWSQVAVYAPGRPFD